MRICDTVTSWSTKKMLRLNGFRKYNHCADIHIIRKKCGEYKDFEEKSKTHIMGDFWIKYSKNNVPQCVINIKTLEIFDFTSEEFGCEWFPLVCSLNLNLSAFRVTKDVYSQDDVRMIILMFIMFKIEDPIIPNFKCKNFYVYG